MDKNNLQIWLDNQFDYNLAVTLFTKYGRNKNLIRFFTSGNENSRNKISKLKYEISKIADLIPDITAEQQQPPSDKKQPPKQTPDTPTKTNWPDEILIKIKEKGDLSNLRDILHRQKTAIPDANTADNIQKRKELGEQIIKITNQIETCRLIINHFQANGIIDLNLSLNLNLNPDKPTKTNKPKPNLEAMTDIERMKKINSLNPTISKANKKLKTMPDGPKKQRLIQKLNNDSELLKELKKMTNA